jgi:hypothetical protein
VICRHGKADRAPGQMHLVARAFGRSPASLVMQLLADITAGTDERRKIRAILDSLDAAKPPRRKP